MQSDGNSFWRDVVFDSFNMEYNDGDSILDKKYEKQILLFSYYKDFEFWEWYMNMKNTAHKNKELIKLGLSAIVVLVCIFVSC